MLKLLLFPCKKAFCKYSQSADCSYMCTIHLPSASHLTHFEQPVRSGSLSAPL